jgi:large subunit ribosomal protein L32
MAHPKYRFSKQRTRKRRANYKAEPVTFMVCSNCGAPVQYHRVCTECGFYKGKLAIDKEKTA